MQASTRRGLVRPAVLLSILPLASCSGGFDFFDDNPPLPTSSAYTSFTPVGLTASLRLGEPITFTASLAISRYGQGPDESHWMAFDATSFIRLLDPAGALVPGATSSPAPGRLEFLPAAALRPGTVYRAQVNAHGTWGTTGGQVSYVTELDFETWDTAALDASYAVDGLARLPMETFTWIAALPDGGVMLGETSSGFKVFRLDAAGIPDPTFGEGGRTFEDALFPAGPDQPRLQQCELALDSASRLVAGCAAVSSAGGWSWRVFRLDEAGRLDPTFGTGGVTSATMGSSPSVGPLRVLSDDSLLLGIGVLDYSSVEQSTVLHLLPDGTRDSAFDSQAWRNERLLDLLPAPDGGVLRTSLATDCACRLVHDDGTGHIDSTFGTNGGVCLGDAVVATGLDGAGRLHVLRSVNGGGSLERRTWGGALDLGYGLGGAVALPFTPYHRSPLAVSANGQVALVAEGNSVLPGHLAVVDADGAITLQTTIPIDLSSLRIAFGDGGLLYASATFQVASNPAFIAFGTREALVFRFP